MKGKRIVRFGSSAAIFHSERLIVPANAQMSTTTIGEPWRWIGKTGNYGWAENRYINIASIHQEGGYVGYLVMLIREDKPERRLVSDVVVDCKNQTRAELTPGQTLGPADLHTYFPGTIIGSEATFACAKAAEIQSPNLPIKLSRVAEAGVPKLVSNFFSIHPDCSTGGYPRIKELTPPKHGTITMHRGEEYSNFPPTNQRYECNKQKSAASYALYKSDVTYKGTDNFTLEVVFPEGDKRLFEVEVEVE
jgi:hypothetical protein